MLIFFSKRSFRLAFFREPCSRLLGAVQQNSGSRAAELAERLVKKLEVARQKLFFGRENGIFPCFSLFPGRFLVYCENIL